MAGSITRRDTAGGISLERCRRSVLIRLQYSGGGKAMNSRPDSIKTVTRILLVAAFALVPIVPESVFADPYSRPSFSPRSSPLYTSPYSSADRSPSSTSPSLPNYTYKSQSKSYSVGDYSRHTYKYKDSLGNRHKGTIEVFPGGTVRHKGKVNGRKFKGAYRNRR